ncbi:DNA repair protein RecO [Candidatus Saccharibacteria bacterium]|nr:DNA repair protein RecO [Candidatus Saccharibacteria bacterium]
MSSNTQVKDIRTKGYILKRTNYGEADRILSVITPEGKMAVMARGVRKPRSKLAGGIEMFTLADINVHFGRSEMGVLTGARMVRCYLGLMRDLERLELASGILKRVERVAEGTEAAEYFRIVDQSLAALDDEMEPGLVKGWALLHLRRAMGEEVNLYRDVAGKALDATLRYDWDGVGEAFCQNTSGEFGVNELKMARLMATADLNVVGRVRAGEAVKYKIMQLIGMIDVV